MNEDTDLYQVLVSPHISEKSTLASAEASGQIVFKRVCQGCQQSRDQRRS